MSYNPVEMEKMSTVDLIALPNGPDKKFWLMKRYGKKLFMDVDGMSLDDVRKMSCDQIIKQLNGRF